MRFVTHCLSQIDRGSGVFIAPEGIERILVMMGVLCEEIIQLREVCRWLVQVWNIARTLLVHAKVIGRLLIVIERGISVVGKVLIDRV